MILNVILVIISMSAITYILFNRVFKNDITTSRKPGKVVEHVLVYLPLISLSIAAALITCSIKFGLVITFVLAFLFTGRELNNYNKIKKKRNIINKEFPLLLDFLVLQVESGHSILQALKFASVLFPESSPLKSGLNIFHETIQLGSSTENAFDNFADYLDTDNSRSILSTISQSMKYGTPIGEVLENQAARMKAQLLIEGEKFSNTLSIKLLIPLLFFVFPASFLVIFSPVIVSFSTIMP